MIEKTLFIVNSKKHNKEIEEIYKSFPYEKDLIFTDYAGQATKYAKNFRTYYNFVRNHETLGKTPAQAGKLEVKPEWKEILVKSLD